MRVESKRAFHLLRNLRLDQSFFRPSTCLIRLTEKLAGHYQSLTFLSRCKKNNLIPTFIKASLPPTTNIRATDSFNKFLARTGRQLLSPSSSSSELFSVIVDLFVLLVQLHWWWCKAPKRLLVLHLFLLVASTYSGLSNCQYESGK